MKKRMLTTSVGTINLAEMELMTDSIEIFIPITAVSENLKAIIEENIQRAKDEYQKEFLDCRGLKWGETGVDLIYQGLHIVLKEKSFLCSYLCFDFEDREKGFWTGFNLDVDLSEHTTELKKLIMKSMIDKFFS